jgi:hypothetical protein
VIFGIAANLSMSHDQLVDVRKYWLGRVIAFDSRRAGARLLALGSDKAGARTSVPNHKPSRSAGLRFSPHLTKQSSRAPTSQQIQAPVRNTPQSGNAAAAQYPPLRAICVVLHRKKQQAFSPPTNHPNGTSLPGPGAVGAHDIYLSVCGC